MNKSEEESPADGVPAGKLTVVQPSSTAVDKVNENSTTTKKTKQPGVCEKVFYINSHGKKCFFTPRLAPRKRIRQRDVQPSSLTPSNEDYLGSDQKATDNQIEASKTDNPNIINSCVHYLSIKSCVHICHARDKNVKTITVGFTRLKKYKCILSLV